MKNIVLWLRANTIYLKTRKTDLILFRSKGKQIIKQNSLTYPEGFSHCYTGMGAQILASPQKIYFLCTLFSVRVYVSSFKPGFDKFNIYVH